MVCARGWGVSAVARSIQNSQFSKLNSQLCEQKNVKLVRIRDSVAYMKQTNFIFFMMHVLYLLNTDMNAFVKRDAECAKMRRH